MHMNRCRAGGRLGPGFALALAACGADGAGLTLAVDQDVGPRRGDTGVDATTPDAGPAGGAVSRPDAATANPDDAATSGRDALADALPPPPDAAGGPGLVAVTLDLSTLNLADPIYLRHVSSQPYEDFLGAALRALDADLVALQGLLPPTVCATANEIDPLRTCFEASLRPTQAERLLGPDYRLVCDAGRETTCLGVHTRLGVPADAARTTSTPPLPPCSVGANTCDDDHCDEDAAVTQVPLDGPAGPLSVVFFMLSGAGRGAGGFYTGQGCRAAQVDQLFEAAALAPEATPLLLGDLAFDPESPLAGASGDRLSAHVAPVGPFTDHAPREPDGTRSPTELSVGAAQDTLLTRGPTARCEALGGPEFDAAFNFALLAGGAEDRGRINHRPVLCRIAFAAEN